MLKQDTDPGHWWQVAFGNTANDSRVITPPTGLSVVISSFILSNNGTAQATRLVSLSSATGLTIPLLLGAANPTFTGLLDPPLTYPPSEAVTLAITPVNGTLNAVVLGYYLRI